MLNSNRIFCGEDAADNESIGDSPHQRAFAYLLPGWYGRWHSQLLLAGMTFDSHFEDSQFVEDSQSALHMPTAGSCQQSLVDRRLEDSQRPADNQHLRRKATRSLTNI